MMKREDIIKELQKQNGTVMSFPNRGPWGASSYRGNCSGWYQAAMMYKYDVKKFAELFAGSGTGADVARDMNVKYIGADLNPNPVRKNILSVNAITDDVPDEFYGADFTFMHPPYSSLINIPYCGSMWKDTTNEHNLATSDLGRMDWDKFIDELNKIVLKYYAAMDPYSRMGILMGDIRRNNRVYSMLCDIVKPGVIEQVIIKTQHNTWSENRTYTKNNFFYIQHEYLLVLKKLGAMIIDFMLPRKYELDIRDSEKATWNDVVNAAMNELKEAPLDDIYELIAPHKKAKNNPNWKAKVRQTLQLSPRFSSKQRGVWALAA